ncbi:cytochrome b5 isoform X1 [Rhynchophorus ferrugineus]|uniref:cytochrome b5 isoform X1 n=1 Tax=Rhynchophorus ferrugineus TaxID=354439 RepID=UPI003FCC9116
MVQEYTVAQVKEQNKQDKVLVLINNDVYDVTSFLNEHPGGEEVLLEQAGKDATEAFEDVGHSSDAREKMKSFQVGTLVASERKPEQPKKSAVDWKETGESSDSSLKSWVIPIALGLVATLIYRLYFMS